MIDADRSARRHQEAGRRARRRPRAVAATDPDAAAHVDSRVPARSRRRPHRVRPGRVGGGALRPGRRRVGARLCVRPLLRGQRPRSTTRSSAARASAARSPSTTAPPTSRPTRRTTTATGSARCSAATGRCPPPATIFGDHNPVWADGLLPSADGARKLVRGVDPASTPTRASSATTSPTRTGTPASSATSTKTSPSTPRRPTPCCRRRSSSRSSSSTAPSTRRSPRSACATPRSSTPPAAPATSSSAPSLGCSSAGSTPSPDQPARARPARARRHRWHRPQPVRRRASPASACSSPPCEPAATRAWPTPPPTRSTSRSATRCSTATRPGASPACTCPGEEEALVATMATQPRTSSSVGRCSGRSGRRSWATRRTSPSRTRRSTRPTGPLHDLPSPVWTERSISLHRFWQLATRRRPIMNPPDMSRAIVNSSFS